MTKKENLDKLITKLMRLSELARKEGLLAIEDFINKSYVFERNPLHFGLQLVVDGTDSETVSQIMTNLFKSKQPRWCNKKYYDVCCNMAHSGVLSIQRGDNPELLRKILISFIPDCWFDVSSVFASSLNTIKYERLPIPEDMVFSDPYMHKFAKISDLSAQKLMRSFSTDEIALAIIVSEKVIRNVFLANMHYVAADMVLESSQKILKLYTEKELVLRLDEIWNRIFSEAKRIEIPGFENYTEKKLGEDVFESPSL
jgi:hypothetical protein